MLLTFWFKLGDASAFRDQKSKNGLQQHLLAVGIAVSKGSS